MPVKLWTIKYQNKDEPISEIILRWPWPEIPSKQDAALHLQDIVLSHPFLIPDSPRGCDDPSVRLLKAHGIDILGIEEVSLIEAEYCFTRDTSINGFFSTNTVGTDATGVLFRWQGLSDRRTYNTIIDQATLLVARLAFTQGDHKAAEDLDIECAKVGLERCFQEN